MGGNQLVVNFTSRRFFHTILGCFSGVHELLSFLVECSTGLCYVADVQNHIKLTRLRWKRYYCEKVWCKLCIVYANLWVLIAHPFSKCRTKSFIQLGHQVNPISRRPLHFVTRELVFATILMYLKSLRPCGVPYFKIEWWNRTHWLWICERKPLYIMHFSSLLIFIVTFIVTAWGFLLNMKWCTLPHLYSHMHDVLIYPLFKSHCYVQLGCIHKKVAWIHASCYGPKSYQITGTYNCFKFVRIITIV